MLSAFEIRRKMVSLADGAISINAFENWLDPFMWELEQAAPDVVDLVYSIQLLFAERDNRRLNAEDLRRDVVGLLNHVSERVSIDNARVSDAELSASRPFLIAPREVVWVQAAA